MISIKSFGKAKNNSTSSSNSGGVVKTTIQTDVNGVYVFGQFHDHKSDVDGDIKTSGSVTADGNITTQGDITANNATITENVSAHTGTFNGGISADDCNLSGDVSCVDVFCSNISADGDVVADTIEANDGTITNLVADYLTVTKQAHFFELVIDKIKSNAGQIIVSAANAKIDKVDTSGNYYILYWRKEDPVTEKTIENMFIANDQVICQTFNLENDGNTVNNRYYWGLVYDAGETTLTENGESTLYNYIRLDPQYMDNNSVSIPQAGDEIVQLGYRGNDDAARQSAIIISSYKSPDPNAHAPSIVQYTGINDYTLNGKILNKMAADGTTLTGTFKVVTGNTTTDVVDLVSGTIPTIVSDSDAAFVIADSNSKMHSMSDAQGLPTNIKLFEGDTQIDFRYWTSNSYIKNGTQSKVYFNGSTVMGTGLFITKAEESRNGGVDITWGYAGSRPDNDYSISNHSITVYIEYIDGNETKTIQKNIPMNVIKSGATVAGADAEFDKMKVNVLDLTAQITNVLNITVDVQVMHIKGDRTTTLSDLTDFSCNILLNNGTYYNLTRNGDKFTMTQTVGGFMDMTNPPTSARLNLLKNNATIDTFVTAIKFNAGSIFEVKEDAITAAVASSNGYTDTNIAAVNVTANAISSRVTAIENDYVTSSELTQTADSISMNVYDELRNRTGIDVQQGTITLNANTTTINGNLNLNNADNGITIFDTDGTPRIQLQPSEIGSVDNYNTGTVNSVLQQYYQSGQSNYNATFAKKKIGQFNASDTIGIRDITTYMASYLGSTNANPSANSIQLVLSIFKEGNNTALQSYTYTLNKTNAGQYTTNSTISYAVPTDAVYLIGATITCNDAVSSTAYVYEEVLYKVSRQIEHQTYIGVDGFVSNPAANCLMWAGSEELQLRWEQDGIRLNTNGLQRLPNLIQQNTLWLPMDNYTTVTDILSARYTLNNKQYQYTVDPISDKGLLSCSVPSFNQTSYSTHLYLPSYNFTRNGTTYTLPQGYKVTIVNGSMVGYSGSVQDRMYLKVHYNDTSYNVVNVATFVHLGGGTWIRTA